MALTFTTMGNAAKDEGLRFLIYGRTGVGKTLAAASAALGDRPELSPVLVANIDRGLNTVRHISNLRVADIECEQDLRDLVTEFQKAPANQHELVRGVRTLIVDSLSALRDVTMQDIAMSEAGKGKRPDMYGLQIQDYNRAKLLISHVVDQLKRVGVNIIFTAEVKETQSAGIITAGTPNLNDALLKALGHRVDFIWYMDKKAGKYAIKMLEKKDSDVYQTKVRLPAFERKLSALTSDKGYFIIPDETFATIPYFFDLYNEAVKESTI